MDDLVGWGGGEECLAYLKKFILRFDAFHFQIVYDLNVEMQLIYVYWPIDLLYIMYIIMFP